VAEVIAEPDLAWIASSREVNYLHQGQALDLWPRLLPKGDGSIAKLGLLRHLCSCSSIPSGLRGVIRGYLPMRKRISLGELKQALWQSIEWRNQFSALGCRGFSYELDLGMKEYNQQQARPFQVRHSINLRIALIPGMELFYPPRIRRFFRRVSWLGHHYSTNNLPSIAFCFGRKTDRAWYVFVMQSDLETGGPSCVREHFRGWRKVLFANVVAQAARKIGTVYLCRAEDVERACYHGWWKTRCVPDRWRSIYDGTALQWGMQLVKVSEPVNLQIYRAKKPVYSEYFYELRLSGGPRAYHAEHQEALCTGTP
jgi:hypothetical protein